MLLVQRLGQAQRAARRVAEAAVRVALQRRQVVEQVRTDGTLADVGRRDLAACTTDLGDARLGFFLGTGPCRAVVALRLGVVEPGAGVGAARGIHRRELALDEEIRLGNEVGDQLLARCQDAERRRLHATDRDDATERGATTDRRGARGVHADEPVRLAARACGHLEVLHLVARLELLEAFLDRLLRHRRDPETARGLLHAGHRHGVRIDQFALAPRIACVDDFDDVVAARQAMDDLELLLGITRTRAELEGLDAVLARNDRQVLDAPLLERGIVVLRLGELDEMADCPRDDVSVALEEAFLLRECSGQRVGEVASHGRLLGHDQGLRHACPPSKCITARRAGERTGGRTRG